MSFIDVVEHRVTLAVDIREFWTRQLGNMLLSAFQVWLFVSKQTLEVAVVLEHTDAVLVQGVLVAGSARAQDVVSGNSAFALEGHQTRFIVEFQLLLVANVLVRVVVAVVSEMRKPELIILQQLFQLEWFLLLPFNLVQTRMLVFVRAIVIWILIVRTVE